MPLVGMVPADQCFCANQQPTIKLRLIVQRELVLVDCMAKVFFQVCARIH